MGCSSSRASNITVHKTYDNVLPQDYKHYSISRGIPDGQEKFGDIRECHTTNIDVIRKYRQCQVTQSTYVSGSTTSLEQSLT